MNSIVPAGVVLVALTMSPAAAAAQTPLSAATGSQKWEATALAGVLAGRPRIPQNDVYGDDWYHTGQAGVILGRHLSTHVKVEIELAATGEGRQYRQRRRSVPNVAAGIFEDTETASTLREGSASVVWQFFENQWIHPFVHAGVAVGVAESRVHILPSSFYTGDPRSPGTQLVATEASVEDPVTTMTAQAVMGGGAKMYVNQHVFVRADGRVVAGPDGQHVAFRVGFGFDF